MVELSNFARHFDKKGRLVFIGAYRNGLATGTCWQVIRGGGCVVGRADKSGQLTGIRIAYIYPDFCTALVGTFVSGQFQRGQRSRVCSVIQGDNGIKIPVFAKPEGEIYVREISNFDRKLFKWKIVSLKLFNHRIF